MAEFPALPLWTDAYLGDTTHLTTMEHGAYLLLLIAAWRSKNCDLPKDDKMLARLVGLPLKRWLNVRSTILAFFNELDGRLFSARLRDEKEVVKRLVAQRISAGKASALKRKNRDATSVEIPLNARSTPTPTPTPTALRAKALKACPSGFVEWYEIYPRHVARGAASKAFSTALTKIDLPTLMAATKSAAKAFNGADPKFIPYPATWLNGERWLDQPPAKSKHAYSGYGPGYDPSVPG